MKLISVLAALAAAARGVKLVKDNTVIVLATMEDRSTSGARVVTK
ncbi:hypothetical protein [Paraburkholderia ginsengiterrae]|nr:hypothetical protein [Paraburkholderia ginsengiterrae]